jgi:hypothetical protein
MLFFRIYLFSILFFSTLNDLPKDKTIFRAPLKIPEVLSANFGELRIDHFHSGLDIKTQGVTGKEVVSAADGYVYRIGVAPGGFGNALYVKHPNGYSTVYGHLDRFIPKIEEYVRTRQYENKSFAITLFPSKDEFPVKQGELIAYSGNSGGSGGPHLHFEIRKSDNEEPVNPLLFTLGITDNIKPTIEKLLIYPSNRHSSINNRNSIRMINVTGSNGSYTISPENEITINGMAGFGIKTFDRMNDSQNKCGVYSIELSIDSTLIYKYLMDEFPFTESRYINSHIDYSTFMKEDIYVERTFVLPGDRLSVYKHVINRGLYDFRDFRIHKARIVVTDASGNKSTLTFHIKPENRNRVPAQIMADRNEEVMPYNKPNKFSAEGFSIDIPSGALYDTLNFEYKKVSGTPNMLSDVYYIHNKLIPLQKPATISIKPKTIPEGYGAKMLIIQLDDDQKKNAVNSRWSDEALTADILTFGRYFIGIDTVAPYITPEGLSQGINLSGRKLMKIRIKDDLSGIKSYHPSIDGKWALFEYDQKNELLTYRFDETRISKSTNHELILKVTDNKDNIRVYKCDFTW